MSEDRATCAGRYRLERVLGRGPSGVVYAATDIQIGVPCALKRLHAQFHDETALMELQRDALLVLELAHPAVVAPMATGFDEDGGFYLVSERVAGESLRTRLQRGALSLGETLDLFRSLCAALEAAHPRGLHHGDLSPGNVLCPTEGPARLTDFGMHRLGALADGQWNGPVGYLPPEVYRGEAPLGSARGDVFALGALLFECLSGQRLFEGASPAAVMFRVCVAPLPALPATVAGDRERLDALVAMACNKDPAARFDHAGALWRALQAVVSAAAAPVRAEPASPTTPAPLPTQIEVHSLVPSERITPVRTPDLDTWAQEESPPDPPPPRPRAGVIAGWAVAGGVAMAALLLFLRAAPSPPPPTPAPAPPVAAAPPAPAARGPAQLSDSALLLSAEEQLGTLDHRGALASTEELLRRSPDDPAVRDLDRRVREALRFQAVYEGFLRAAERSDTDAAVALYRELPPGSPFRDKAQGPFAAVRGRFEEHHLAIAGAALDRGACDEVQRQADQLLEVADRSDERAAGRARRLVARCRGAREAQVAQARTEPERPLRPSSGLITPDFSRARSQPSAAPTNGALKDPFRGAKLPPQR